MVGLNTLQRLRAINRIYAARRMREIEAEQPITHDTVQDEEHVGVGGLNLYRTRPVDRAPPALYASAKYRES